MARNLFETPQKIYIFIYIKIYPGASLLLNSGTISCTYRSFNCPSVILNLCNIASLPYIRISSFYVIYGPFASEYALLLLLYESTVVNAEVGLIKMFPVEVMMVVTVVVICVGYGRKIAKYLRDL